MKIPELTEKDIKKIQELYEESMRIHTDDSYIDWLLSWDFDNSKYTSIYDDDIQYSTDLTPEEIEVLNQITMENIQYGDNEKQRQAK